MEDIVERSEAGFKAAQSHGEALERQVDAYVAHSEARMRRWMAGCGAFFATWWRRFVRWRDEA